MNWRIIVGKGYYVGVRGMDTRKYVWRSKNARDVLVPMTNAT